MKKRIYLPEIRITGFRGLHSVMKKKLNQTYFSQYLEMKTFKIFGSKNLRNFNERKDGKKNVNCFLLILCKCWYNIKRDRSRVLNCAFCRDFNERVPYKKFYITYNLRNALLKNLRSYRNYADINNYWRNTIRPRNGNYKFLVTWIFQAGFKPHWFSEPTLCKLSYGEDTQPILNIIYMPSILD